MRVAVEDREQAGQSHREQHRQADPQRDREPSAITESAMPVSPWGSARPADPERAADRHRADELAGTSQSARPPSSAA